MPESLGPGATFAGCRLEAVAGRGGMGVVFRATQVALERPVALKAIAPELAADKEYRERFERESHLAASIDHPNIIPVYQAGELDGTLYLMMRWVEGTDLRTLLTTSGRVSPVRAIRLLRPVSSALSAAHRRGLVHRDIKPANVMIARTDEESEDHPYLTDFGIARRTDGRSLTRTGMFVGTIDYTAPERIEGGKGEAPSDIYALGCVLFETLTGHVPFDRPTEVAKILAHINDPIPSARREVKGVPEQLDAIIAQAMAKDPQDRFQSAGELTAALGEALQALETAERVAATPQPRSQATKIRSRPPETGASGSMAGSAGARTKPAGEPTAPAGKPTRPAAPKTELPPAEAEASAAQTRPTAADTEQSAAATEPTGPTGPTGPSAPTPPRPTDRGHGPSDAPRRRRSAILWALPLAVLVVAGVLVGVLSGGSGSNKSSTSSTPTSPAASTAASIKIKGGLTQGQTITVAGQPGSVALGRKNLWTSLPNNSQLVRFNPLTGDRRSFPATGSPTAIVAGFRALWVGQTASRSLAQFNGDSGEQVAAAKLAGSPTAIALDQTDSTAWVADSSGAISHVVLGGQVIGTPAHSNPAAMSIAWGEGWLWAVNGADKGLVRVSLGMGGSSAAFPVGPRPVGVTLDQGVWSAHSNGHVTRFDPRAGHLRVNADIAVAPELDAIAATDPSPVVWAISKSTKTLYRITNTNTPAVTGTVVFASPPVALTVRASSVWVATQDGKATEIRS